MCSAWSVVNRKSLNLLSSVFLWPSCDTWIYHGTGVCPLRVHGTRTVLHRQSWCRESAFVHVFCCRVLVWALKQCFWRVVLCNEYHSRMLSLCSGLHRNSFQCLVSFDAIRELDFRASAVCSDCVELLLQWERKLSLYQAKWESFVYPWKSFLCDKFCVCVCV